MMRSSDSLSPNLTNVALALGSSSTFRRSRPTFFFSCTMLTTKSYPKFDSCNIRLSPLPPRRATNRTENLISLLYLVHIAQKRVPCWSFELITFRPHFTNRVCESTLEETLRMTSYGVVSLSVLSAPAPSSSPAGSSSTSTGGVPPFCFRAFSSGIIRSFRLGYQNPTKIPISNCSPRSCAAF